MLFVYSYAYSCLNNLTLPVSCECTSSCFSMTVNEVFRINPVEVGCVLIDFSVLGAWFLIVVIVFELTVSYCEYSKIYP